MPHIAMYADSADHEWLISWLLEEPDIAWIVRAGRKRWRAVKSCDAEPPGRYCIWHVPSGPLPLYPEDPEEGVKLIENPWAGWVEPEWQPSKEHHKLNTETQKVIQDLRIRRNDLKRPEPYFGAGHPGIIWYDAYTQGQDAPNSIAMSSFGWIGNRYKGIGKPAPAQTEKWWQRLRRRVKKRGVKITREGPIDGPEVEIWALQSALEQIRAGAHRDLNPYLNRDSVS